jgi:NAD(P)-dependent dehydrogenase (short-subunit alcohol dehydrogenase family)
MLPMFRLDGRVVAVIGAGSGIGEAVARGASQQGARVHCLDVSAENAAACAERIRAAGGTAESAVLDVTDGAAVDDALTAIARKDGALDACVCTPGVNFRKKLLDYREDEFDKVIKVNLTGTFHTLRSAGRIMAAQGRGSIVIFSSMRCVTVEPGQSVYAATKAAIVQLVRGAACELGASGVRVNAVAPGIVDTALTTQIKTSPDWYAAYANHTVLKRWASPDEMAGPTLFLISDAASYVTGSVLFADAGWTGTDGRFTPPGM